MAVKRARLDNFLARTWTELSTVAQKLACQPPFSFYFDVVEAYWKAATPSNSLPLHRICTLARKQGATLLVVESATDRGSVIAELDALDAARGGGGAAEAIAMSFFQGVEEGAAIADWPANALIGQLILINYRAPRSADFTDTYIFEAILRPPTLPGATLNLLNNYLCPTSTFSCTMHGRVFELQGIYYCQQNQYTSVCAHACLRMALNGLPPHGGRLSNEDINASVARDDISAGLTLDEVVAVIDGTGKQAEVIDCSGLDSAQYLAMLASVVESGDRALLVFPTEKLGEEHVVAVFGHTRNSDEWHPQAIPAYAGAQSAQFYTSSMWVDHLLIHDDNFGPYYTLSSRTLEAEPCLKAHYIIAIRDRKPQIRSDFAQGFASIILSNMLPSMAQLGEGKWFEYITRTQYRYVLRTILVGRENYCAHLMESLGHDQSKLSADDITLTDGLPDQFWMVEYSLPALYTGNRTKLGEVLIATTGDMAKPTELVLALRVPSLFLVQDGTTGLKPYDCGLTSHSPVYRKDLHVHEW